MVFGTDSGHYGPTDCGRTERERVCVFKVTSPDSERYGQWETERVCVCSKDHNRWFFAGSFRKVAKYSRILLFCLFCQQGGAVREGGARAGKDRARGGPTRGEGGARARKDRARGSSTGALCTGFTHTCALGTGHTLVII